jgi:hypothetical protein
MLESESEHPAIKGVHESMLAIGVLGTVPWLLSMISKVPGAAAGFSRFTTWCHQQLQEKRKVRSEPDHAVDPVLGDEAYRRIESGGGKRGNGAEES